MVIGPLKIKNRPAPNQKYEAECHLCRWAYFKWKLEDAEELLRWHLDNAHFNPPPRPVITADMMPGR